MIDRKRILFFDDQLSGHHLEYIHHLYEGACNMREFDFIFAVPEKFNEIKNELLWKESDNIKFHFLENNKLTGNLFLKSFYKSQIVKNIALRYLIDEVFFIALIGFLPAITFVMPKRIKISGILYLIYLYRWKQTILKVKFLDFLKYLLLSMRSNFKRIFILNDRSSSVFLNKKFNTSKFTYLPDPYPPIDEKKLYNIREKYNISHNNTVYLHFGGLSKRKGTLKILNAIELLDEDELKNKTFIFAGKLYLDIKEEFYRIYNRICDKVQILCFDKFCEYSFLSSLCLSSDFILLPYSNTAQSSGVIGYGAQFKIPVVVPKSGLLGKLVRKYNLGYSTDVNSPDKIADFLKNMKIDNNFKNIESRYISEHNVSQFIHTIFSNLM